MASVNAAAKRGERAKLLERHRLLPFLLIALLFPLWGFANDLTNPLVRAFKDIFLISNAKSSLVQFAFYLGYGIMALPGAIFIRRFSYKSGILLGLALAAVGAALFIPASVYHQFYFFLLALCVLTCGLALLEVTANPYILSMGHADTATRRLNLAQAFNPLGSLAGMWVAAQVILSQLQVEAFRARERAEHPEYARLLPAEVDGLLNNALGPYLARAVAAALLFVVYCLASLPETMSHDHPLTRKALTATLGRLVRNGAYVEGVIAQAFYVGAQIMCWTFIIQYGMSTLGLTAAQAQGYNMIAMLTFLSSRFVSTFLLGYIRPGFLLLLMAVGGAALTLGAIFLDGYAGLYALIGISACMATMYPSIYGIALKDMGDDASLASAGIVMAIVGGALMPPLQGQMIDSGSIIAGIPAVKTSFLLPLLCFVVIGAYAYRSHYVRRV